MFALRLSIPRDALALLAGGVGAGALGLLLGALGFEHWGGLAPCPLCLEQRGPLAAAAILALFAASIAPLAPRAARIPLALAALVFLIGAGYAVYHSGVERHWWEGPAGCTGRFSMPGNAADFAAALAGARIMRCDEIPFAFLGLSLANWNVLFSAGLAALAGLGAWRAPRDER